MKEPVYSASQLEPLLSIREAGEILGVSQRTVFRLVSDGELAPTRIRDRVLFAPEELRAFIARKGR